VALLWLRVHAADANHLIALGVNRANRYVIVERVGRGFVLELTLMRKETLGVRYAKVDEGPFEFMAAAKARAEEHEVEQQQESVP
jgi:hypothetical protein